MQLFVLICVGAYFVAMVVAFEVGMRRDWKRIKAELHRPNYAYIARLERELGIGQDDEQ